MKDFSDKMGIGDWGLGIGDWAQSPIPNPQSPIPNIIYKLIIIIIIIYKYNKITKYKFKCLYTINFIIII